MDRVHQYIARVHGPAFIDQGHGHPIFTTPKNTAVNNNTLKVK